MKIAIDARFLGPAGTGLGKYAEKLLENLEKIDPSSLRSSGQVHNEYFILLKKNNFNLFNPKASNFHKVLADIPWYSISEQIQIPKILSKIKPDLTHFCHFNVPIFYSSKFVVTIHDLIKHEFLGLASTTKNRLTYYLKHRAYKLVISAAIKNSVKILVPSNWVKKRIAQEFKVPENKIVVTYEAADEEFFRAESQSQKKEILKKYKIQPPFLIYVGNAYPYKNLDLVLKAFKILEKDFSNLKFFLASTRDVFHQRFTRLVGTYNLNNKVVMPGFIPSKDLVGLFRQASAYVFPSLSEGFGIPGLDAMAAGLPVLASDIPVFREVYADSVLYFNPKDPAYLATKIKTVLENNKLRQNLIEKGQNQAANYSWQKMTKETLLVYNSYKF